MTLDRRGKAMDRKDAWTRLCTLLAVLVLATGCSAGEPEAPAGEGSVGLADYELEGEPVEIEGVRTNLSGVTYVPETKTLWAVMNGPTDLLELGLDGTVLRRLPLAGGWDTEGIAWMGDGKLAVAEEGAQVVYIFPVPDEDAEIVDLSEAEHVRVIEGHGRNTGLEGVAHDPEGKRLFGVREKPPAAYEAQLPAEGRPLDEAEARKRFDCDEDTVDISDAAGCCYDEKSGHLLIVSDESACVVECTLDGEEVSRLELMAPQAEGVTLAPDGTLYVVSEPNLLYVYKPKEPE